MGTTKKNTVKFNLIYLIKFNKKNLIKLSVNRI